MQFDDGQPLQVRMDSCKPERKSKGGAAASPPSAKRRKLSSGTAATGARSVGKPRGRAPKGSNGQPKVWDYGIGTWCSEDESGDSSDEEDDEAEESEESESEEEEEEEEEENAGPKRKRGGSSVRKYRSVTQKRNADGSYCYGRENGLCF